MPSTARPLGVISTLAAIAATWVAASAAHAESPFTITFNPADWHAHPATVDWIAASPWDENYRPPLAAIRASVSPDAPKYGPDKWSTVNPEPVFVPDDPGPLPDPEPDYDDYGSDIEWLGDGADYAWVFRQLTPSGTSLAEDHDFDFEEGLEIAIYLRDDRDEGLEVAYYTGDMTVEDTSSGSSLFARGTVSYFRVSYVAWAEDAEDGGIVGFAGGGWIEEHISSDRDVGFEAPDLVGGAILWHLAVGYVINLGGPLIELRAAFDMTLVTANIFHTWFGVAIWF